VKEKLIRKVRRNRKDFIRLFLSPVELSKGPPSLPRKATIKSSAAGNIHGWKRLRELQSGQTDSLF
jgi:hypothetical protein